MGVCTLLRVDAKEGLGIVRTRRDTQLFDVQIPCCAQHVEAHPIALGVYGFSDFVARLQCTSWFERPSTRSSKSLSGSSLWAISHASHGQMA
jgi:hypothetical protein